MKIVPYLINHDNYTFLPEDMAETHIKDGILREVKLIDFKTPVINSYMVYRKDKRKMLDDLITQYL
jgi:LysR family transcriptional repressor of citA